jgi:hypothetical protein
MDKLRPTRRVGGRRPRHLPSSSPARAWGGVNLGVGMPVRFSVLLLCLLAGCSAFKFVYIPCEQDQPMEDWHLSPKDQEDEIACLTSHLQMWYGKRGLTDEQKRAFKEHVRFHLKQKHPNEKTSVLLDNPDPKIADLSSNILTSESVEIVTLLPPLSQYGYVTISIYIDDKGMARNLPHNHRASSLLETVSTRAGPILGDAFVACTYDNEGQFGGFRRLDMGVEDISSSAGWIKVCQRQKTLSLRNNDKIQQQMNDIKNSRTTHVSKADENRAQLSQLERDDEDLAVGDEDNPLLRDGYAVFPAAQDAICTDAACLLAADALRERGNGFYNERNYLVAVRKYSKARRYLMHSFFAKRDADASVADEQRTALLTKTELNLALAAFHAHRVVQCEETCKQILGREPGARVWCGVWGVWGLGFGVWLGSRFRV